MFKSVGGFLIALLFLVVGILMLIQRFKQLRQNTAKTKAKIIDLKEEEHFDADTGTSIVYYPLVQYYVNGIEYRIYNDYGCNKKDLGKEITINYNPENPKEFNISNHIFSWVMPVLVTLAGLAVTIMMINW